jgi:hypothetical protein
VRRLAKLPQDFSDLLIELCETKAEFLLVGGWAVILYGHVRATDDMDIFVRPSTTNSERVFAALEAFGAPLRAHAVAPGHALSRRGPPPAVAAQAQRPPSDPRADRREGSRASGSRARSGSALTGC